MVKSLRAASESATAERRETVTNEQWKDVVEATKTALKEREELINTLTKENAQLTRQLNGYDDFMLRIARRLGIRKEE